ncbi:MAG: glutathione peroxidase [Candidatus Riflebacteria bacterium]|nr:glutathione peroxidase [Candidatus Riflebacteria bacterium]
MVGKIYDFKVKDTGQNIVSMNDYRDKVLLIVNTATGCGFTPQYEGLETLYKKYGDQGLEILDFPCNQFLQQAPGSDEEIVSFCQLKYGVSFKTFAKIEVNGDGADPLFKYLKEQAPVDSENADAGIFQKALLKVAQAVAGGGIKWNFTKFLVDRQGNVVARFAPTVTPEKIESHIVKQLEQAAQV